MHNIYNRVNAVTAQATTWLLLLMLAVSIASWRPAKVEPGSINVTSVNVMVGRGPHSNTAQDFLFTRFDLKADLRDLFNWNTKQLMLQVVADFQTEKYPENAVVLWDRIVRNKKNARLNMEGLRNKYAFKSLERLTGTNMTISLQYNLMPKVGFLQHGEAGRTQPITIPAPQQNV